ncbi:MAG TPA: DNA-directed RNA polymerase subunit beta' [Anaerolineae bacterium]|nr:DNA-directed RNA polymerase subunit beta' [Anaerolineae bacterium]
MEAKDFRALRVSLASPDRILSWSYGEVTKPETINYRRLRPEKDGLFCEAIFGPTKDWQCYCGKYKNVRYRGIICDKCGVEVTRAAVRRERMGHIELAAPVAHVWYTRRVPSYLGVLLDVSRRNLDRVLYFAQYVVTYVDEEARQKALKRLDEEAERERKRLESMARESNRAIKEKVETELDRRKSQLDQRAGRLDEKLNEATEAVMKEAQTIQSRIEERMGKDIRTPIAFSPTKTLIAEKGETIGREHLTKLNKAVKSKLAELEAKNSTEREKALAKIEDEIEHWQAASKEEQGEIDAKLAEDAHALDERISAEREEIQALGQGQFLTEARYRDLKSKWGQVFKADMGAEAFLEILKRMELDQMSKELWREVKTSKSKQKRKKAIKRLRVVESLRKSGNRPEWMILTYLPVIPPDLRPMVQLDGGRFATSDLNDLYRRVINRNNRLKRLLELGAPDVIVRNEKRMLQEAVDSLIDNSQRGKALSRRGRRELKSLSDMLKGKKGRFRRNLLGKRVDYSGRSVIVIGPKLKLHQCGLPKTMALELYRPFVISKLVEYNFASNVKGAKRIIERERPEVWEVLEEVIKQRPVLLNRAPTLHRLGIQAFEPVLVEGKAIQIHPLVCPAFNADFDGDQMAVHVPLSDMAVQEARDLMLSTKNLLKPASGEPIVGPAKDMVLGVYYLTMVKAGQRGEGHVFSGLEEVELAYNLGLVDLHAQIKVNTQTVYAVGHERYPDAQPRLQLIETTVGRALFNMHLPSDLHFVNEVLDKSKLNDLVARCYLWLGLDATTNLVDAIKNIGFEYATHSGTTIAVSDFVVPDEKQNILKEIEAQVNEVDRQYRRGLLTEKEQYTRTIELWQQATSRVADAVKKNLDPNANLSVMALSGATKGGFGPISQLAGMRGLMADPAGNIIALPIKSNFREGLTALEYFISTHGARKGLADTALRTADAGYLTRRLVDVAQDQIINTPDCGTKSGIWIRRGDNVGGQNMTARIIGRTLAGPVLDPKSGEMLGDVSQLIDELLAQKIDKGGVKDVYVRSPMVCELRHGLCQMCYGRDLGRGLRVDIGTAVGIVAAQSIGEPGTQLTLRTFHTGGVAAEGDITHGLPRVEELFEARKKPRGEAVMSDIDGSAHILRGEDGLRRVQVVFTQEARDEYDVPGNWSVKVEDGQLLPEGELIASRGEDKIVAKHGGKVQLRRNKPLSVVYEIRDDREYEVPSAARLMVEDGQAVAAGQQLSEGALNPHRILRILGREATQLYILSDIQQVYRSQGQNINDKHFEVIIRKMLSRVQIVSSGDSELLPGELVDRLQLQDINEVLTSNGKRPATAVPVLLGVTKAALTTDSFLSASSFQHTIKVLAGAAIEGKTDDLFGLKENVIIGKLIPAGTGFKRPDLIAETEEPLSSDGAGESGLEALETTLPTPEV